MENVTVGIIERKEFEGSSFSLLLELEELSASRPGRWMGWCMTDWYQSEGFQLSNLWVCLSVAMMIVCSE